MSLYLNEECDLSSSSDTHALNTLTYSCANVRCHRETSPDGVAGLRQSSLRHQVEIQASKCKMSSTETQFGCGSEQQQYLNMYHKLCSSQRPVPYQVSNTDISNLPLVSSADGVGNVGSGIKVCKEKDNVA